MEEANADLIHVKSMVMDIPHYPELVRHLSRVLRPGGLLILVESELSYVSDLASLLMQISARGPPSNSVVVWSEALRRALAAKNSEPPRDSEQVPSVADSSRRRHPAQPRWRHCRHRHVVRVSRSAALN